MLSKASFQYQLFVFRRIFLQTSCCLVRSPRELYPQVHKEIINLTAWFSVPYNSNYFIFLQKIHKSNTSWMSWWTPPSYLRHCNCDWLNDTMLSNRSCRRIPRGMVRCHLVSSGPGYVWLVEPYHVVPLESSATPKHGIWVHVASYFYTIQWPICYLGCLMIANTWIYIFLYLRNTAILENKKTVCIFLYQYVNTCDLHLHISQKLFKLTNRRHLYWVCANILHIFFFKVY